jgi:hypothetical protein
MAALATAGSASAHHSFAAVFDPSKPATLNGTVVSFEFVNPHGWVTMMVKGADGSDQQWRIEVANPNQLLRLGWKRDSLKPGDMVSVATFLARDGTNTAIGQVFKLADGRQVLGGAPPPSTLPAPAPAT